MVDREKVIKGLECHVNGHPHTRCHKCPYWGTGPHGASECSDMVAGALALLKAQEPRVMTLEEADKAPYVWLESDQGGLGVRRVRIVPEDSTAVCIMAFGLRTTFHESGDFEKHFRCWSEKPSDELRKGTLWT